MMSSRRALPLLPWILLFLLLLPLAPVHAQDCPPVWPSTVPCNGHGQCVNGTCVCNDDWSGVTDMTSFRGVDCATHLPTRKALLAVCLAVGLLDLVGSPSSSLKIIISETELILLGASFARNLVSFDGKACG